jgi:hypothetical protein
MRAEYAQTAAEEVLTYSGSDPRVARNAGCGILLSRLGCTISPKESKPSQFQCKASDSVLEAKRAYPAAHLALLHFRGVAGRWALGMLAGTAARTVATGSATSLGFCIV